MQDKSSYRFIRRYTLFCPEHSYYTFSTYPFVINGKITIKYTKNTSLVFHMFISSAYFQKYKRSVDESVEVLMAETVAPTSDQMFEEIRYKSLCIETYTVKQVYSPATLFFISAKKKLLASK